MSNVDEQIEAMVGYILSSDAKLGVVRKMGGDLADLCVARKSVVQLKRLLASENVNAQAIGLSALYLTGMLACALREEIAVLYDHPFAASRKLVAHLIDQCSDRP